MNTVVIGIGDAEHGDDAAGLAVAERLRKARLPGVTVCACSGAPAELVEAWKGAQRVVIVGSCCGRFRPGEVQTFEAAAGPLPVAWLKSSTHSLGVAEALERARAARQLPRRLTVYEIAGPSFEPHGLSPVVASAVDEVAHTLARELRG